MTESSATPRVEAPMPRTESGGATLPGAGSADAAGRGAVAPETGSGAVPSGAGGPEPVLMSLRPPARRSLADGLVRPPGPVPPGIRALEPELPDAELADLVGTVVHTADGFVARTGNAARALAILAATAAALCGEDVRRALAAPDIPFLTGLNPQAVEAVRGVLLWIEAENPAELTAELAALLRGGGAGSATAG
ncbi:hypothetical protein [Nocardia asteroides]|uniref:hypothetical protein n=1 Tax=Nocardia asteroides TaxID=1824 RepID=UPI001E36E9B7|nr:hypothetical protein [Nocardia asteroides]UGT59358.1 hypothetical protein LTT61_18995 [Nocardia asteroides]